MAQVINSAEKSKVDDTKIVFARIISNEKEVFSTGLVGDSKTIDLQGGFAECNINESIFADTVKVSYIFVDTAVFDNQGKVAVKEDLVINTTEDFEIKILDDNGAVIQMNLNLDEYVTINETANNSSILFKLVSEEFLTNQITEVRSKFNGEISSSIKRILEEDLKTKKPIIMKKGEKSQNLNFTGNNERPFYKINWASKHDSPDKNKPVGGFLLFETTNSKGGQFNYVSIEKLFEQEPKKKFIYNENPTLVEGYDGKILDLGLSDLSKSASERLLSGAYITKIVTFDPSKKEYKEVIHIHNPDVTAAKRLPTFNEKFKHPSAKTYVIKDTGSQPNGDTNEQIKNHEEENFNVTDIANQARARYNQIQSQMISITIAGDFTLHAGDCLFIDSASFKFIDRPNTFEGGKYLIVDLCHHLSSKGCFTKMNLSRDSVGRTPFRRTSSNNDINDQLGDNFTTP
tara:strand:- start:55 stop:1431 length:1377 start_codon:yes stop_codon:yes gene_type:complete